MTLERRHLTLSPRWILRTALLVSAALVALHLAGLVLSLGFGRDYAFGFVPMFNLNAESNAPTLFSSLLLVSCGVISALAGYVERRWRWQWWFVAAVFVLLGVDETFGLHEPLFFVLRGNRSERTAGLADALGGLRWSDVLPWLALAGVLLFVWFWGLIRQMHPRVLISFAAAAAVYLLGVVGIDGVLVTESELALPNWLEQTLIVIEETCEFVGPSLFLYAAALHLSQRFDVRILLGDHPAEHNR